MFPEIALSSILIIVAVLFPGLIFRRFYYIGTFAKQYTKGEWSERLVISIFWGILVELIALIIFSYLPWVKSFLEGNKSYNFLENFDLSDYNITDIINQNREYLILFLSYIIFSNILSGTIGYIAHLVVRIFKLDIKFSPFRYSNVWHYCFSGESESLKIRQKVLFTWIDLVLKDENVEDKNKMIQGALSDYSVDSTTGDLEYLYFRNAKRYDNKIGDFKKIEGDVFVVPFKNVLDMNIRYEYKPIKKRNYEYILSLLVLIVLSIYVMIPWILAKNVPIWRILLSYFPALISFLGVVGFIAIFFNKEPMTYKQKKPLIVLCLILTIIGAFFVRWILGYGFGF